AINASIYDTDHRTGIHVLIQPIVTVCVIGTIRQIAFVISRLLDNETTPRSNRSNAPLRCSPSFHLSGGCDASHTTYPWALRSGGLRLADVEPGVLLGRLAVRPLLLQHVQLLQPMLRHDDLPAVVPVIWVLSRVVLWRRRLQLVLQPLLVLLTVFV